MVRQEIQSTGGGALLPQFVVHSRSVEIIDRTPIGLFIQCYVETVVKECGSRAICRSTSAASHSVIPVADPMAIRERRRCQTSPRVPLVVRGSLCISLGGCLPLVVVNEALLSELSDAISDVCGCAGLGDRQSLG